MKNVFAFLGTVFLSIFHFYPTLANAAVNEICHLTIISVPLENESRNARSQDGGSTKCFDVGDNLLIRKGKTGYKEQHMPTLGVQ